MCSVKAFGGGLVSEEVVNSHLDVLSNIAEYQGEEAPYHRLLFTQVDEVEFVSESKSGRKGRDERYQDDDAEKAGHDDISDEACKKQGIDDPDHAGGNYYFPLDGIQIPLKEEPIDSIEEPVCQSAHRLPQNTIHLTVKWKVTR